MKIKQIKKLKSQFLVYREESLKRELRPYENTLLDAFIAYIELKNKERKCGTPDDSGQLPMPPDLILVDLN